MPPAARARPSERAPGWPEVPTSDSVAEVARLFAMNLKAAIGDKSLRAIARDAGLHHSTLTNILDGHKWPDFETIAKVEQALGADVWPRRFSG